MALVAAAIEAVARRNVDGSLWWDSFRELLNDFKISVPKPPAKVDISPELMKTLVRIRKAM